MLKDRWSNFFRHDLQLNRFWWHRLAILIFLVSVIYIPTSGKFGVFPLPETRWREAGDFSTRITSDIRPIELILKPNEIIYPSGEELVGTISFTPYLEDTYYSLDLVHQYTILRNAKNITDFYISDGNLNRLKVTEEVFCKYIRENSRRLWWGEIFASSYRIPIYELLNL